MPNRSALLVLVGLFVLLWALARACAVPPAESAVGARVYMPIAQQGAPRCNRWRGDDWMPCVLATLTAEARVSRTPRPTATPTRASATWAPAYPEPRVGVWSWVDVAVARAADDDGKPTAAPVPSATRTPTATHPPRATRTPRATGTPTQSGMATVPACGCGTLEPGEGTRFPGCWPYGGTCAPTDTPAPTASDTPPATATWEPTPTAQLRVEPVAGGWVPVPEVFLYRFPIALVWRVRR